MKKILAKFAGYILVAIAVTTVTTASTYWMYRPEIPAELLEE